MRYSFVLFGLAAVALANLNQNANEMRDVSDTEGSKVEADTPTRLFERDAPCCSSSFEGCVCYTDEVCCLQTHPDGKPKSTDRKHKQGMHGSLDLD
ncbi:hypothetical protein E4U47_007598 [Claviceps purpurea]|nr:hypothetical protein E4U47_007598 [Claviceps purpurea]